MTQDEPDCGADLTTQPQGAALVSETSEPLHPPQPEREKVEPLYTKDECDADLAESMAILGTMSAKVPVAHAVNIVNSMIQHLQSQLSTALVISQNYQSLMVTAERETGEAKAIIANLVAERTEMTTEFARSTDERDELRSSLARVVEALTEIEKRTLDLCTFGALERAIDFIRTAARSALHRSQEEG